MAKKKRMIITVAVITILAVIVIYMCIPKRINSLYEGKTSDITRVTVMLGGTGDIVVTKDQNQIEEIAANFGKYKVHRKYINEPRTGWSYTITIYWGDVSQTFTCIGKNTVRINGKVYVSTGVDESIESIVHSWYQELADLE